LELCLDVSGSLNLPNDVVQRVTLPLIRIDRLLGQGEELIYLFPFVDMGSVKVSIFKPAKCVTSRPTKVSNEQIVIRVTDFIFANDADSLTRAGARIIATRRDEHLPTDCI